MKESKNRNQRTHKRIKLYKPRKKKSVEEDAAIQYLQAQYDKISLDEIKTFKDLPLSQKTLKGLKDNNYITPTEIQRQAIAWALQKKDILGAAKTGSGKTLAFLVPILENLFCKKWTRLDGLGALVISPTRELAYQIYETLRKVGYLHDFSAGLIIGGQNLKFERKRMDQVNILICTPGRLLQHMDENPLFDCSHLQILVLDEADRCLDLGFEATMNSIIENLPAGRQTLLFSATQTKSVKDLARLSLSFPTYIAPHEQSATVTPDYLQQSYIVCKIDEKVGILWSFIKNHLKQKILVFMSTCKQVKYINELFCKLRPGVSILALYGTLHQEKREKIYNEFCRKSNVVLFATDLASRGLDFPLVNWVVQMDCPEDVDTYIHRAGRTARGVFGKGEGLLVLLPHEEAFIEDLRNRKIPINKICVDPSKVIPPQRKIEVLLSEFTDLKQTAQRAFMSYIKSIYLMKNKMVFDVNKLDTDEFARSLGLKVPPQVKFLYKLQSNIRKESVTTENLVHENLKHNSVIETHDSEIEVESSAIHNTIHMKNRLNDKDLKSILGGGHSSVNMEYIEVNTEFSDNFDNPMGNVVTEESSNNMKTKKILTKAIVAKRILKKKINVNTRVKFTELIEDCENKLELVNQHEEENIANMNIRKVEELLQELDKFDNMKFRENVRVKHKEKKYKLKNNKKEDEEMEQDDFGSESESDAVDLSWLPDPDTIYGKNEDTENELLLTDWETNKKTETNKMMHIPTKRKLSVSKDIHQDMQSNKKKKIEQISASLSVHEAEELAINLLRNKSTS